jgi:hypothetical protein
MARYDFRVTDGGPVRRAIVVLLSVLTLFIASTRGNSQVSSAGTNWSLDVTPLAAPAAPNSAQPQLFTQGDRVVLSWIERSGDRSNLKQIQQQRAG